MIIEDKTITLQEIRMRANELTKMVDNFVAEAEKDLNERKAILDKKIKEYALLNEREKNIAHQEEGVSKDRVLLKKEQDALNEKQKRLELKEQELDKKIQRVNELMST